MGKPKNLNKQIEQLEDTNYKGIKRALQISAEENRIARGLRTYEKIKFEKFKEIIKDEQYFKLEHFKQLEIDYDILIHLSAKNSGKTTELYRCINDTIKRGEKFIYGRITVQELRTEVEKFATEKNSPVTIIPNQGRYYFFTKSSIDRYIEENSTEEKQAVVSFPNLIKAGIDWVGLGMTFMNSNTLGSGTYEKFTAIFFDEIISYTPREYVNEKILSNWGCAISTILRNKKQLTILMMGNLRNNLTTIPLLDYYGIDIADDLRIIKRSIGETSTPCTILYVNSGSLYSATIKNQAAVAHHASLDDRLFLENNKIVNTSSKVLTRAFVDDMKNIAAVAVQWDNEDIVLNLRETGEKPNKFALCIHKLTLTTELNCPIYSDSIILLNKYSTLKNGVIEGVIDFLYTLCSQQSLYYDSNYSLEIGPECINELHILYERLNDA